MMSYKYAERRHHIFMETIVTIAFFVLAGIAIVSAIMKNKKK